jgi:hypothetical protein
MHEATEIPSEVTETAAMALELHERLYPTKEVVEDDPADNQDPNYQDQHQDGPNDEEEETYKRKHDSLKGRFDKMSREFAEMRQYIESAKAAPQEEPKQSPGQSRKEEILAKLNEEYPEELIENLRALQRIEAEEVAQQYMQPIQKQTQSLEDIQYASAQQEFISVLTQKAPNWQEIWAVADELKNGLEPSNERVAAYLESADPSGLYTNYELIQAYNNEWDADRMAIVCNMYSAPKPQREVRNFQREAMVAPSRVRTQPSMQSAPEKRMWTMKEFQQFQVDARNDKYDDATKAEIWADVQSAISEGRIRG